MDLKRLILPLLLLLVSMFTYADSASYVEDFTESSGWIPKGVSPDVLYVSSGAWGDFPVVQMPCDYSDVPDGSRCYWDKTISADMSEGDAIRFRLYISDVTSIDRYTIYLGSPGGWFGKSVSSSELVQGWQTITINKSAFNQEGAPEGWDNITTIRVSPWKATGANSETFIAYDSIQVVSDAFLVEDFEYPDETYAQNRWQAYYSNGAVASPVELHSSGEWGDIPVSMMACVYNEQNDSRCYWDRKFAGDFSDFNSIAIKLYISDLGPMDRMTFYFGSNASDNNWYTYSLGGTNLTEGWQTITIPKFKLGSWGTPENLETIDRIRLSHWSRPDVSGFNFIAYDSITLFNAEIAVVIGGEYEEITNLLDYHDLHYVEVPSQEIETNGLSNYEVLILADVEPSADLSSAIDTFVSNGGKVIAYGNKSLDAVANELGIQRQSNLGSADVVAMSFDQTVMSSMPSSIPEYFTSTKLYAVSDDDATDPAEVLAYWKERDTGAMTKPAWFINSNGAYSHQAITTASDHLDERAFIIANLLAHFSDSVAEQLRTSMLNRFETVGDYSVYSDIVAVINSNAAALPVDDQTEIGNYLDDANTHRDNAIAASGVVSVDEAYQGLKALEQAYLLSLRPPAHEEVRYIWEHFGFGAYHGDWSKTIASIKDAGFSRLLINSARGGTSVYPSAYLEDDYAWDVNVHGPDPLYDAIEEAHNNNIQVHFWKVFWNIARSSNTYVQAMQDAGRTQVTYEGDNTEWLTPCLEENRQLELNVLAEVINNYNVDGYHMDYNRFASNTSYDPHCRSGFEAYLGAPIDDSDWPSIVGGDGDLEDEYRDWRASIITQLVSDIKQLIDDVNAQQIAGKPHIVLSGALIRPQNNIRVAQYWDQWIAQGLIDIAHPMTYEPDLESFQDTVGQALVMVNNQISVYPGLGAWKNTPDGIAAQIEWLRSQGLTGFTYFSLTEDTADNRIPLLGQGVTYPDRDQDGDYDLDDNCPSTFNPNQSDDDDDGIGNVCDIESTTIYSDGSLDASLESDGDIHEDYYAKLGDTNGPTRIQMKTLFTFDLSSLSGKSIESASLSLVKAWEGGGTSADLGAATFDLSVGGFNDDPALESEDFDAQATVSSVGTLDTMSNTPVSAINVSGISALQGASIIQLRGQFAIATDDDSEWDYEVYYTGDRAAQNEKPQLLIEYTLPD